MFVYFLFVFSFNSKNTKKILLTSWLVIFIPLLFGVDQGWIDSTLIKFIGSCGLRILKDHHLERWMNLIKDELSLDQLGLVVDFLPPPFHLHPFLSLNGQWVKVLRLVLTNRSLIFFDPNQTQLDPWSSELFCVKDRLLLGQANNQKSIQGPSPFVLAWQVYGAWLTSHDL